MFGIILVNFPSMNTFSGKETVEYGGIHTAWDQFFAQINFLFFNEKFYPIFATLFGLGLYIFYQNAKEKTCRPKLMTLRRLGVLFCFGILHIVCVWWGDILLIYSILGFLSLLLLDVSAKKIFPLVCALLIVYSVAIIFFMYFAFKNHFSIDVPLFTEFRNSNANLDFAGLSQIYSQGSFVQIAQQRLVDYVRDHSFPIENSVSLRSIIETIDYFAQIFGSFLLGICIAKMQWHCNIVVLYSKIKKVWGIFAILTLLMTWIAFTSKLVFLVPNLKLLQGECVAIFYTLTFVILLKKLHASFLFRSFQAVGKMSLTAYVSHTTIASFLLYGYGLGLFGKIGPMLLFFVSIVCYGLIAIACKLWLKKFQFGPLEYVLRSVTYFKWNRKKTELAVSLSTPRQEKIES